LRRHSRQGLNIATQNDRAVYARIFTAANSETGSALGETPTGRPGRVTGAYEKVVTGLPYIIAYAIAAKADRETVSILRVIHTARDWPVGKWPE
jgi:plasmid stabilization system protein ParE